MKEQLKAVDIVVIPPDHIQDLAIDLSKKVVDSAFVLGKTEYVPHISLCMGYAGDIEKICGQVEESLRGESSFSLVIKGVEAGVGSVMNIGRSQSLKRIHYKLLNAVDLVNDRRNPEAYVDDTAREETLNYMMSFRLRHARLFYSPHITLGDGVLSDESLDVTLPIEFVADRVALFHLGNYNTCRRLLKKWELGV